MGCREIWASKLIRIRRNWDLCPRLPTKALEQTLPIRMCADWDTKALSNDEAPYILGLSLADLKKGVILFPSKEALWP